MANTLAPTTNWTIKVGGDEMNGGGFDPGISGAGTNWSNQAAPHVIIDGVTIIGTVAGAGADVVITGYTVATTDKGNHVRIASGTNCVAGDYCITAVDVGTGTWTLGTHSSDAPFTGASADMVARMGGAFADAVNFSSGGTLASPALASPWAGNHTVNHDGGGISKPTKAQASYDWSAGYWVFTVPSSAHQSAIKWKAVNGNPMIKLGALAMVWDTASMIHLEGIYFYLGAGCNGILTYCQTKDCVVDTNGQVCSQVYANAPSHINPKVINTGAKFAGTGFAIQNNHWVQGAVVQGFPGKGINLTYGGQSCEDSTFSDCYGACAILTVSTPYTPQGVRFVRNTIDTVRSGDGVQVTTDSQSFPSNHTIAIVMHDNNIMGASGYGINGTNLSGFPTSMLQDVYNNNVYGNGAAYNNWDATATDTAIAPAFKDPANFDWSPGTALKGLALSNLPGSVDIGGMQRVEGVGLDEIIEGLDDDKTYRLKCDPTKILTTDESGSPMKYRLFVNGVRTSLPAVYAECWEEVP